MRFPPAQRFLSEVPPNGERTQESRRAAAVHTGLPRPPRHAGFEHGNPVPQLRAGGHGHSVAAGLPLRPRAGPSCLPQPPQGALAGSGACASLPPWAAPSVLPAACPDRVPPCGSLFLTCQLGGPSGLCCSHTAWLFGAGSVFEDFVNSTILCDSWALRPQPALGLGLWRQLPPVAQGADLPCCGACGGPWGARRRVRASRPRPHGRGSAAPCTSAQLFALVLGEEAVDRHRWWSVLTLPRD